MFATAHQFARTGFPARPLPADVSRLATLVAAALLVSLVAATGPAAAAEDPRFEIIVGQTTVPPGRATDLAVTLVNDADEPDDRVETAVAVSATMRAGDTPFEVTTGTRTLGALRDGQPTPVHFGIDAPQDVPAGTYHLPIDVTYEYEGDERASTTVYATVRVRERARFAVVDATDDVRVGADGLVNVTIENVGEAAAGDATVEVAAGSPALSVGGAQASSRYAGEWAPGERKTLTYEVAAKPTAEPRSTSLSATVRYDDDGAPRHSVPLSVPVSLAPDRRFDLAVTNASLRAGRDGALTLAVTNVGEDAASDVELEWIGRSSDVHPDRTGAGIGALAPGETATATFPVTASADAAPGTRRFVFRVAYDQPDGDRFTSRPFGAQVDVAPETDRFAFAVVNATVPAGESRRARLTVRNVGGEALTAVDAKAYTDAPFEVTDGAAFVGDLAPGEERTIAFGVDVPDDAAGKRYPLSVDVQYETPDGDTELSRTYDVPVTVGPSTGPPTTLLVGGGLVGVLVLGGLGYWLLGRR